MAGRTISGSAGAALPQLKPTLFDLRGDGVSITYTTTSITGQPTFRYQDGQMVRSFTGDQIITQDTDIGTLVTVLLQIIPDVRTLTVTVVLPNVILNARRRSAQFRTFLVLTNHNTGFIAPSAKFGPQETYRVIPLVGTASAVVF